ncbi:TetR/AcrR family transcriptional regulator [Microbacterium halotolerans]|uniref:TetR/AcrR family transcriptional regulator n=1 Tax=Microbacterium halotolerans TaxID=246613 RepID=UPI0013C2DE10|nr:TetR/AcrR family transcriptional regulator [Microbacterium halotolerans]
MPKQERAQRRDAAQNRERILDRAEELFQDEGLEIGFHRIADVTGVGVGTVYRHFPDRGALFLAIYRRNQARLDEVGEEMLKAEPGMPRVLSFMDGAIRLAVHKPVSRRISARVLRMYPDEPRMGSWAAEVMEAVETAKADGDIRDDAELGDIAMLATMVADLATAAEPQRSRLIPRMRAYVLDALRPEGAARPSLPSEPMTPDDLTGLAHQGDRD